MTDLASIYPNQKPFTPQSKSFFDGFYLTSTVFGLTSIAASKFLQNSKALPFFTAFILAGSLGVSAFWKRKDIDTIDQLLKDKATPSPTKPDPQLAKFQSENERLQKLLEERNKEFERLKTQMQTPNSSGTPSNYKPFQAKRNNENKTN